MNDKDATEDLKRIGRIIQLIKIHRRGQTIMSQPLSQEQYLKYYLSLDDWAFWQKLQQLNKSQE